MTSNFNDKFTTTAASLCDTCNSQGHTANVCIRNLQLENDGLPLHCMSADAKCISKAFALLHGEYETTNLTLNNNKYIILKKDGDKIMKLNEELHSTTQQQHQQPRRPKRSMQELRQSLLGKLQIEFTALIIIDKHTRLTLSLRMVYMCV